MPFDKSYYDRYYANPRTAVTSRSEMTRRANMISACVKYLDLPVKRVLDAGCGLGLMRAPLRRVLRRAEYVGLEISDYLCARYGWRHGALQTWRPRERFELVICYDVLQYLTAAEARLAIANLARLCRGALYLSALTRADWSHHCDQTRTDKVPGLRSGDWYRRELRRHFEPLGCGLWLRRGTAVVTWELDRA